MAAKSPDASSMVVIVYKLLEHNSKRVINITQTWSDLLRHILAKGEAYPLLPVAMVLLLNSFNIALLLEDFSVLGHVLGRVKAVKVPDVMLAIEDWDERSWLRAKVSEWHTREEGDALDLLKSGDTLFGASEKAIVSSCTVVQLTKSQRPMRHRTD